MAKVLLKSKHGRFIEVLSGADKGSTIPLTAQVLTIGRSDENDIVVQSEGVSRNHAKIVADSHGISIMDNGSKNGILVNGSRKTESPLSEGDIVQVGDFSFRVRTMVEAESPMGFESPIPLDEKGEEPVATRKVRRPPNKRFIVYTGLILFLGGAYWLSMEDESGKKGEQSQPKVAVTDETTPVVDAPVVDAMVKYVLPPLSPELKRSEEALSKLDWADTSVRTSEDYFRRGAREYSNQNYHRAIEGFQTALQIDKNHVAARKYLNWALQESELEAKKNMGFGVQYFDSLQYQRAIHHFQEVIALMAHRPLDPMIGQSEKYIESSKRMLEKADFFP